MKVLLDTHVLLLWLTHSDRLDASARELFEVSDSELLWSAASTWELGIKVGLGKLSLPEAVGTFVQQQIREQGLVGLPIYHDHAARAAELPLHHRDPFDRMLVAQALVENVPLVTRDSRLREYGVQVVSA